MSMYRAKRLGDGRYEYRHYLIEQDGCLASGNDGAWLCMELRLSSGTFTDLKREIDRMQNRMEKALKDKS